MLIIHADVVGSTALSRQFGRDAGKDLIRRRLDALDAEFLRLDTQMVALKRLGDAVLLVGPDAKAGAALRIAIAQAAQGDVRIALGVGDAAWTPNHDDIEGAVADLVIGRLSKQCAPGGVVFDEGMAATLRDQPASLVGAFRERTAFIDGRDTRFWVSQIGRAQEERMESATEPARNGNGDEMLLGFKGWGISTKGRNTVTIVAILAAALVGSVFIYSLAPAALIVRGEHEALSRQIRGETATVLERLNVHDQRSAELFRAVTAMCHGVNFNNPRLLASCPPLPRLVEPAP